MELSEYRSPLIIAHRGYSARFPENTLVGFQAALDTGADFMEFDVALTQDRRVVVIHDDTLDRTTDGRGPVGRCTFDDLRKLDAGAWFHPRHYGEKIPTFEEVLDLVGDRAGLNIEIKAEVYEPHQPGDAIEKQVVDQVQEQGLGDSVVISSFEWKVLERISRMDGAPGVGLLSKVPADESVVAECRRLGAVSWNQDHRKLTQQEVDLMHEAGVRVFAYTVNDIKRYGKLLDMGVDGVFTDDPAKFSHHALGTR